MVMLRNYPVLTSADLDIARDAVTSTYLDNRLTQLGQRELGFSLAAVEGRHVTIGCLSYSTVVNLQMPPADDFYHLNLTTAGHTDAWRDDGQTKQTAVSSAGVVLLPHMLSRVTWSDDAEQVIFRFTRQRLEDHLSQLLGRPVPGPISFDLGLDLRTAVGRNLYSTALQMVETLDRLQPNPAIDHMLKPLEELVMTQLLYAADHPYREDLERPLGSVADIRLDPVITHIEARLCDHLTLEELAAAGNMSIRSLHALFQSALHTTPRQYILERRLACVDHDLRFASPGSTVSDIATRWGFTHLSRFSAVYRKHYGLLPSETLQSGER